MGINIRLIMRFTAILVLIASASAIKLSGTPMDSKAAYDAGRSAAAATVAAQQKFEADHLAMHTANMAKVAKDCLDHKNHVRSEREKQREGKPIPSLQKIRMKKMII